LEDRRQQVVRQVLLHQQEVLRDQQEMERIDAELEKLSRNVSHLAKSYLSEMQKHISATATANYKTAMLRFGKEDG
jgi:light-regulated signal transduction histidine kinase (bacteriophytochrome)